MAGALVVFESMFGNTEVIARAIGDGVASAMDVDVMEVGAAPVELDEGVELLIAGGPTHAFGMSRPATRADAVSKSGRPAVSGGIGLREWLGTLRLDSDGVTAAAFDTKVASPRMPGSAARAARRRLRRLEFRMVTGPESFFVAGTPGPLLDGEEDRARRWAVRLGSEAAARGQARQPGERS